MSLVDVLIRIKDEKIKDVERFSELLNKYVQLGIDNAEATLDSSLAIEALDKVDVLYGNFKALQKEVENFEDFTWSELKKEVEAGGDAKQIELFTRMQAISEQVDKKHSELLAKVWIPGLKELRQNYLP